MIIRIVVEKCEILVTEREDIADFGIELHVRQWTWYASKLETCLIKMIKVEMGVACSIDEVSGTKTCYLSNHEEEKGI